MINFKTWLFLNESLNPLHPDYSGAGNIPGSLHDAVAQLAQDIHNTKTKDELTNVLKKYNLWNGGLGYTSLDDFENYLAMQNKFQNYELRPDTNYWKNANEASKIAEKKYSVHTDQSGNLATKYNNPKNASQRQGAHKLHVQIYNHNSEKLPQIVQKISSEPEFEDQFFGFKFATLRSYSSDFTDKQADQTYSLNEPRMTDKRHRRDRFLIYLTDKGHKDKKIQNYLRSIDVPFDGSQDSTTASGGSSTQIYAAKLYYLFQTKLAEFNKLPPPKQSPDSKHKFHWHIPHLPDMGPEGVEPEKFVGHEKHIGQIRAEILGNQLTFHGTGFTEFLDLTPEQVKEIKKNWTKQEILENRNLFGSIPDRKQLWSGSMKLGMVDVVLHGNKLKISSLPSFANHVEIQLTEPQYMQMLQTIATIQNHNK